MKRVAARKMERFMKLTGNVTMKLYPPWEFCKHTVDGLGDNRSSLALVSDASLDDGQVRARLGYTYVWEQCQNLF